LWDFAEVNPFANTSGAFASALEWVALAANNLLTAVFNSPEPRVVQESAIALHDSAQVDLIITDPPYYDAIPYSDLMDFFYVWLRRSLHGHSPEVNASFLSPLGPKWDRAANDGELIDDESRHEGAAKKSKRAYEEGMYQVS